MQEPSSVKRVYDKYPQIDLIFGVHQITKLPYLLYEVTKSKERMIEVTSEQGVIVENLPMHRDHQYKAFVSIMDGCKISVPIVSFRIPGETTKPVDERYPGRSRSIGETGL